MKKLLFVNVDEDILTKASGNSDLNDAIEKEFGWLNESGIFLDHIGGMEDESEADNWLLDMQKEENYDRKSDLIKLVATVIEDDFTNFECDKDILYDLLRSVPYKKLMEYLSPDDQDDFLKGIRP